MNLKEIERRVVDIYSGKEDDEYAHVQEDELHLDFIKYIAKTGTKEQRKMAREILKADDFDFSRWYA